jgi:hypothetical protein
MDFDNNDIKQKNNNHFNAVLDRLLNIISSALSYHISMDGTQNDEDTNEKIYSNIFKTIDMLMTAWLMIEKNYDIEQPILNGLDLEIEDLNLYHKLEKKDILIKNNNLQLILKEKKIDNIPDEIKTGINSKFLLLPYNLNCESELFMTRYLVENNKNLKINNKKLNVTMEINEHELRLNNISINFHPSQYDTYNYLINSYDNQFDNYISEGLYYKMEDMYFTKKCSDMYDSNYDYDNLLKTNENTYNNNFHNINQNINNIIYEKEKRNYVYKHILEYFGYHDNFKSYNIKNINFKNYPNLSNYLSLISSYYGIYEYENNNNIIKSEVDILKNNLLGSMHFKLEQCSFINNNIENINNNLLSSKVYYKKNKKIRDILFLLGNYKKNYQFKLSSYNNLILTNIKYSNKYATIYDILEEFGNQSNNEYIKLWKEFDNLIREHLIDDISYEKIKSFTKLKKDKINYEYKSNFLYTKDYIKRYINIKNFSNFMRNIKQFYEEIKIPIYSNQNNDQELEKDFPKKFRGNNNYSKLFKNRIEKSYNFYQETIEKKIISNS